MMHKFAALVILSGISFTVLSQNEVPKKISARPDIPGTFVLELGFNSALSAPNDFSLGLFGSRTANIYYQYDFRILKSGFSFVPGIGLSLERFKFKNDYSLDYEPASNESIVMISPEDAETPGIKKSQLITNYIDVPLEIRFSTNPEDPARSFKISVGGRVGYMYDSFTKLKYSEDGKTKKLKNKEDFNLNRFRYGLTARIGVGSFSLFGYYNITPLFKDGKGLSENSIKNDFNTLTIGISLASF